MLSDAANGHVYHFQIYAGKGMNCTMEVGMEDEGFDLFIGDYFTIPQLFLTFATKVSIDVVRPE